jgi:23S rRNA (cytosine1962-C5)-methyltransferase
METTPAAPVGRDRVTPAAWRRPWVQLRTFSFHPCLFPATLGGASPDAQAGDLVTVCDREGNVFGAGLYNPRARVPLRVPHHGEEAFGEAQLLGLLDRAVDLRLKELRLPETTDAFRVVHSDGDGLSGLVDRYADMLSVEVHSLGVFQRLPSWLAHLHARLGTRHAVIAVDPGIARTEGIAVRKLASAAVRTVRIREHGVRYEVNVTDGHKTGFFCDQRENRRRLAAWTGDRRVLDLCCYTGGFALSAKLQAGAAEVTGVDLDEKAVAQAKHNANLNQARLEWVYCDAFAYGRQMLQNGRRWEVVVVDPPKLILSREETREGERKYEDLNQLAVMVTEPGGLLVTCSCSGLLSAERFEQLTTRAAHRAGAPPAIPGTNRPRGGSSGDVQLPRGPLSEGVMDPGAGKRRGWETRGRAAAPHRSTHPGVGRRGGLLDLLHLLPGGGEPDVNVAGLGLNLRRDFLHREAGFAGRFEQTDDGILQCAALLVGEAGRRAGLSPGLATKERRQLGVDPVNFSLQGLFAGHELFDLLDVTLCQTCDIHANVVNVSKPRVSHPGVAWQGFKTQTLMFD